MVQPLNNFMLMVNFYLQDAIVRSGHFYYCFCSYVTGQSHVNVLFVFATSVGSEPCSFYGARLS